MSDYEKLEALRSLPWRYERPWTQADVAVLESILGFKISVFSPDQQRLIDRRDEQWRLVILSALEQMRLSMHPPARGEPCGCLEECAGHLRPAHQYCRRPMPERPAS